MDNKTATIILSPFVLTIILAVTVNFIDIPLKKSFPDSVHRIASFSPAGLTVKERNKVYVSPDLRGPMDFNLLPSAETSRTAQKLAQEAVDDGRLSLIVISGRNRTAIIDGVPVKEGDRISDMRIVKIETDRVLLKNKTLKWMYLE